jgi:hypothetical protein
MVSSLSLRPGPSDLVAAAVSPNPEQAEVDEMVERAVEVIHMLEDYKRASCTPAPAQPPPPPQVQVARPPKRPWEDAVEEQASRRVASSPPADRASPVSAASPARAVPPAQEAHMHVFDVSRSAPLLCHV